MKTLIISFLLMSPFNSQSQIISNSDNSKILSNKDSVLLSKSLKADSLSKIKAVLVVGDVEESTSQFIEEMKTVAAYLRNVGVKVKEFYDPYANWSDIRVASEKRFKFFY